MTSMLLIPTLGSQGGFSDNYRGGGAERDSSEEGILYPGPGLIQACWA
jgi:hypothetical protein